MARLVAQRGIPVLDADQLAREVVEPGQPALAEIARLWPQTITPAQGPDQPGRLDRRALGAIVFADAGARARLEAILHPRIAALAEERAAALAALGHRLAFYEASLLVETGRHHDLDGLVVVTVAPDTQLARAMARDGMSRDEARARIAAQLPLADKIAVATRVIDNDGPLAATAEQVDRMLAALAGDGNPGGGRGRGPRPDPA